MSVVSFCHSKNTSARGESCTLTQTSLQNRRHPPSDEWKQASHMLGEGTHARGGGGINKIGQWGGPFPSGHGKKGNIMASCVCGEHDFYVKITPRQKSGNAVARTSVAPVRLHRLIRHKGINTRRIIACGGGLGGGILLHYWHFGWYGAALPRHLDFGIFF